jgi:hypothetical protein
MNNLRKIESKEEMERKRKRNTLFLSIIMIAILVFSTAGYFAFRDDTSTQSNTEGVQNMGDSWVFTYGEQTIRMSHSPEDVKNITVFINEDISSYSGKTVYIASESDAGLYEIYPALSGYAERVQSACYGKCTKDLPEKECNETMIVIRPANLTDMVYQKDNCVFIEGDLKAVDAFLYKIYGMI